jgi:hypothetical protein
MPGDAIDEEIDDRLRRGLGVGFGDAPAGKASIGRSEAAQPPGNRPSRLAMILSPIRFGSAAMMRCRIGSGVI